MKKYKLAVVMTGANLGDSAVWSDTFSVYNGAGNFVATPILVECGEKAPPVTWVKGKYVEFIKDSAQSRAKDRVWESSDIINYALKSISYRDFFVHASNIYASLRHAGVVVPFDWMSRDDIYMNVAFVGTMTSTYFHSFNQDQLVVNAAQAGLKSGDNRVMALPSTEFTTTDQVWGLIGKLYGQPLWCIPLHSTPYVCFDAKIRADSLLGAPLFPKSAYSGDIIINPYAPYPFNKITPKP